MLRTLALFAIPPMLVAAFSFGAITLVTRGQDDESRWVNWDGRAFSSPRELRSWLRARGLTYRVWARNHPYAAARLEGREAPPRNPPAPAAAAEKAAPPPASPGPAPVADTDTAEPRGQPTASFVDRFVLIALLLLTFGLIALAVTPVPVLFALNAPVVVHQRRAEFLATGLATGAGVLAARLLSGS